MARIEDLKLSHRLFVQSYRFRSIDWSPGARLVKPLGQCKIALISSAGLYLSHQTPFDLHTRGGDCSFREIPSATDLPQLRIAHRSSDFERSGVERDVNLAFPVERFQELAGRGVISSLNDRHFSFMGSITAPGRLISRSGPEVAALLRVDGVNAAFLAPV
jgi:D-proline reductase (dithiol) PrdB